jgi:hypothetical protein
LPNHCVVVEPFLPRALPFAKTQGSGLIVVVVEEEYREDALATVVSGLVLGCLLALPDHHPFVVVQGGSART